MILRSAGLRKAGTAHAQRLPLLARRWLGDQPAVCGVSQERLENLAPDRIQLTGLAFFGHHGVLPEETRLGQRFEVDATLFCDLQSAGRHDDLQATTDYAQVHSQIRAVVEGPPSRLIEKVAEDVARTILRHNGFVAGVKVAVRKPHVAVPGIFQSLGVEIRRVRGP